MSQEAAFEKNDRPVVTRFAPSPTGALHIGGARTALFAWAFAKRHGGRFILRVEDTDQKRSSPESTRGILRDLQWLGLCADAGPAYPSDTATDQAEYDPYDHRGQIGDHGPYFQSQRAAEGIYDRYIQLLLDAGKAYEDDGAVRFRMDRDIAFTDAVYGDISVNANDLEDFVIRKGKDDKPDSGGTGGAGGSGGMPTFHFAVVVDDALMEVTHVIRGQEHLSNTTKHAALYDALAEITGDIETWQRPTWVHTPSIMNPGGSKMSKRDKAKFARQLGDEHLATFDDRGAGIEALGDKIPNKITPDALTAFLDKQTDDLLVAGLIAQTFDTKLPEIEVNDFKAQGYLQPALLNYIALLGWNPGGDVEHFDLDFLCQHFALERIGKSNSTFDRVKLKDFNAKAIRDLDPDRFIDRMTRHAEESHEAWKNSTVFKNTAHWHAFCIAVQERTHVLPDPLNANVFLIEPHDAIAYDFSPKPIRKAMMGNEGQGTALLEEMHTAFGGLADEGFGQAAHETIQALAEASGINMGKYAQPVRVAVSGTTVTPPIDVTLNLLGKDATLMRMARCLAQAKSHLETAK